MESTLSPTEREQEYLKYNSELHTLTYDHQPNSPSLSVFLGELERLRELLQLVTPDEDTGLNYQTLISLAQARIRAGVGGRKDLIHDINHKWKTEEKKPLWSEPLLWRKFKAFYCNAIKEYDISGLITAKPKKANNVNTQEAVINQAVAYMDNVQEQLEQVQEQVAAMSAVSGTTQAGPPMYSSQSSIPPVIQTNPNSNTSALGTVDQTLRVLMDERNKFDKERVAFQQKYNSDTAALQNRINALERLTSGSQFTNPTVNSSTYSPANDTRICKTDSGGNKWYQVAHYCSKHGFNISHNNQDCKHKHKGGKFPWIEGATATDTKGGNPRNNDKYQHWYNTDTRTFTLQPL